MTKITMQQIDKAVEMLRDAEPESLRHTVTRSNGHAAIVHAFGASALDTSDEFDECLLHHVGLSADSWLSEKAIALIMWERTAFSNAWHKDKVIVAEKAYESMLQLYDFDPVALPVALAFALLDQATTQANGWYRWMLMCRQYLAARGWEPLP